MIKKRNKSTALAVMFMVVLVFAAMLTGCADKTIFTVQFNFTKDGERVQTEASVAPETELATVLPTPDAIDGKRVVWQTESGEEVVSTQKVTANMSLTAVYKALTYTVTFLNGDGTALETQTVDWGNAATAPAAVPTKAPTEDTAFTFSEEWAGDFSSVKSDMTVTPIFNESARVYAAAFPEVEGCSFVSKTGDLTFNSTYSFKLQCSDGIDVQKITVWVNGVQLTADGDGVYSVTVTGNITVSVENVGLLQYTVTFLNGDGTALETQTVDWGNAATAPATDPTKAKEGDIFYTFREWNGDFSSVKSNTTVAPLFTEKVAVSYKADALSYTVEAEGYAELGKPYRFKVTKNAGYTQGILAVSVNGVVAEASLDGIYTVANVTGTLVIAIEELALNTYTVTVVHDAAGLVSVTDGGMVKHGESYIITAEHSEFYANTDLSITTDAEYLYSRTGVESTVNFQNVTGDVAVHLAAVRDRFTVTIAGDKFAVEEGKGSFTAEAGTNFVFYITLADGYNASAPKKTMSDNAACSFVGAKIVTNDSQGNCKLTLNVPRKDFTLTIEPKANEYDFTVNVGTGAVSLLRGIDDATGGWTYMEWTYPSLSGTVYHSNIFAFCARMKQGFQRNMPKMTINNVVVTPTKIEGTVADYIYEQHVAGEFTAVITPVDDVYNAMFTDKDGQGFTFAGNKTFGYREDYKFSVTMDNKFSHSAPQVLANGAQPYDAVGRDGNVYSFVIPFADFESDFTLEITPKLNKYTITYIYQDGEFSDVTTEYRSYPDGSAIEFPIAPIDSGSFGTSICWAAVGADGTTWTVDVTVDSNPKEVAKQNVRYTATVTKNHAVAKINGKSYKDLGTALAESKEGNVIDIIKPGAGGGKDVRFESSDGTTTFELKKGVILRLPYGVGLFSNFEEGDKTRYNPDAKGVAISDDYNEFADKDPSYLYLNLILPKDCILNVYGEIQIGGLLSREGQRRQGHTSGAYAQMTVDGTLNIYGFLKTFGYVKGEGTVDAFSGAEVYSPLVVDDYRGGSNTAATWMNSTPDPVTGEVPQISPFNLFELPNIQPGIYTVHYGARDKGFVSLYTSGSQNATIVNNIGVAGETGIFLLSEGAKITKEQDSDTRVVKQTFYGTVKDGALELSIMGGMVTVSTDKLYFPVSYLNQYVAAEGANVTFSLKYKFLTGSSLTVAEGATVNFTGSVIGYQEFTPNYTGNEGCSSFTCFVITEYTKFYTAAQPSKFVVNGTLNVPGTFGGILRGTGKVAFGETAKMKTRSQEGNGHTSSGANGTLFFVYIADETARGYTGGTLTEFLAGQEYQLTK